MTVPYTFYSNRMRKIIDITGIVHETVRAPDNAPFARRTVCRSDNWHLFEPLNPVDEDRVTSCLLCLGGGDG